MPGRDLRTDAGTIEVAGQLSPFIELGVGFNPDLPARDNVEINAVMMGLDPTIVRDRFDEIIAFGGLEGFVDQKLKNYSSGMQVRLAFSVMVHSNPDVMLIDEVLAVGDAAFQQKCLDVFYRLKAEGKTIVLVTHAMVSVEQFCDRAMMLTDGDIKLIGEPACGRTGVPDRELRHRSQRFRGHRARSRRARPCARRLGGQLRGRTRGRGRVRGAVQRPRGARGARAHRRPGHRDLGDARRTAPGSSPSARARTGIA